MKLMKIPPFKELNPPDNLGYWTNKKTGEKYGGQYISPLLIPNLKKVEAGFKKAMKNSVGCIIQARSDSKRLPGKVLYKIKNTTKTYGR